MGDLSRLTWKCQQPDKSCFYPESYFQPGCALHRGAYFLVPRCGCVGSPGREHPEHPQHHGMHPDPPACHVLEQEKQSRLKMRGRGGVKERLVGARQAPPAVSPSPTLHRAVGEADGVFYSFWGKRRQFPPCEHLEGAADEQGSSSRAKLRRVFFIRGCSINANRQRRWLLTPGLIKSISPSILIQLLSMVIRSATK